MANHFQGLNKMAQQLPPPALIETWLDIIQNPKIPLYIIRERTKLLCYFFGSIELAYMYVEQNQFNHKKAS